uniref:Uncharacterized protein n=1 Tax=Moniliophthora roreri TaxID=221103 RepID=A0A0W0FQP8_MONRR
MKMGSTVFVTGYTGDTLTLSSNNEMKALRLVVETFSQDFTFDFGFEL